MGTWGTGIFDDDVAVDVKVMFEEDLKRGYSVSDTTRHILSDPPWSFEDEEDTAVMVLALAGLQLEHDALDHAIRERAIHIIDSGVPLWRWEGQVEERVAERTALLSALRQQLIDTRPQLTDDAK